MSLSVTLPNELEQFLNVQAGRKGVTLETLLSQTIEERWNSLRRVSNLPARETELLLKLQNAFPPAQTQEYQDLRQRSDDGTLTDTERKQFIELIEERDLQNAERLEVLGELAQLRGVTLREVMTQLGIRPE